ncbi:TIR domain-containing protein [candidate division KSB3 bacterium]|nr:TIR domain-containing protein [candidate division KSB3 bacterium]
MPFEYACFISYPGSNRPGMQMQKFMEAFKDALEDKIDPYLDILCYMDTERLQGGDLYRPALAQALCKSLCMVVMFTPKYFRKDHLFCTREYMAMEQLETERFTRLQRQREDKGIIIPIMYRGADFFPEAIKNTRHCYTDAFASPHLKPATITDNEDCVTVLEKIAQRTHALYDLFTNSNVDLCQDCHNFRLPTDQEVDAWRKNMHLDQPPLSQRFEALL